MRRTASILLLLLSCAAGVLSAQPFSAGYVQPMPWADSLPQAFLPTFEIQAIGPADSVYVNADGDFAHRNEKLRFWGVNITSGACFPRKSEAQAIAARMAKFGINLVRFHHLDNPAWSGSESSLLLNSQGTRSFNPLTLDRLDYFIYALKQHGIYVNMNLNVSRTFQAGDGVNGADSLQDFGKAVTLYDPYLIFLQQEYAAELLAHVNPYTGMALAADPVLAMVEMVNENSIYGFWKSNRLRPQDEGGALILRHDQLLDTLWISFLTQKYPLPGALQQAWNQGTSAPGQDEQVIDGGFEGSNISADWTVELHDAAAGTLSADTQTPGAGIQSGQVSVTNVTGTDWHIQFKQVGGTVEQDSTYELRFMARSDANRSLSVSLMRDNAPYTWYSGQSYALSQDWQDFSFFFTAPETNQGQLRIAFGFENQVGEFWFDEVSFARPAVIGLGAGESLQSGQIDRIAYQDRLGYSVSRVADMAEFYLSLQRDFMGDMSQYLRGLGVRAPISGANALVGPQDAFHQQDLDYLDDHSYWDHPWFPNVAWDPVDWQIGNTSVLKDPNLSSITGILGGLAPVDKPYTVSEYNHAFPNRFQAEMIPLLTAYGSFHDLDGLMFFDYKGGLHNWDEERVDGFFSIHRQPAIMAQFPTAAYVFRQGIIATASQVHEVAYSPSYIFQSPFSDTQGRWGKWLPYDQRLALTHSIKTTGYTAASAPDLSGLPAPGQSPYTTSNGQTRLDTDAGWVSTLTERFVQMGGDLPAAGIQHVGPLSLVQADGFGVISWLALEDTSLEQSRRSLLTVVSKAQNTGMQWIGTQSVGNNWGNSPIEMAPLALSLDLSLAADSLRLVMLDGAGQAVDSQVVQPFQPSRFRVNLDQQQSPYFWVGIEALGQGPATDLIDPAQAGSWTVALAPDQSQVMLQPIGQPQPLQSVSLLDLQGRTLWTQAISSPGRQEIALGPMASGVYLLRLQTGARIQTHKIILR